MDILYLLGRLENLIASSKRMPLVNQIMLKEADILNIVDEMRTSIPEEVKQARRIMQDRERILAQAQAEASALLTKAREESERTINREGLLRAVEERSRELVRQAEEHAQELVRRAEEHTEQMQVEADTYAIETLHNLREHLTSVETEVSRTILSIEKGLESLEAQQYEQSNSVVAGTDDDTYEQYENGEDFSVLEDVEGEEDIQAAQPPAPRRASLANDTMGGPNFS